MILRFDTLFLASLCVAGLASPSLAQGSDNCATPTALTGLGTFPVDTTGATNSVQQSGSCPVANNDVWFAWTATSNASIEVSLCGGSSADTVMAIYSGSTCPVSGSLILCNDDSCGLQSDVTFPATNGATYLIQIGSYSSGATFSGTFTISTYVPPPPCSVTGGPDVIVGDIGDVTNYSASFGIDAISLGTESCNPGQIWVNWISNTNQHPVIGGNLYRYHVVNGAGRFEQIGQSWLKHAFYALSEILCCPNCVATDGTHLGIGCADTYTASRNGAQSGLGPRWQVNASTGAFSYPPANPAWSGQTARRLAFLTSDVDTSAGARYFGEAQYVTQDDATAGNQNNNASYRELTVSGTTANWSFALSGPTVRAQSAVRAWKVIDPAVVQDDVQVDGLFVVSDRVTSLGGGLYHYEYAVYNMNSDRACGSFTVPVGSGTNVTNIGFHGVLYRDGDGPANVNYSSTDWTSSVAGGVVTWSCETQAQNGSANALRWGTTYNFRFDADVPPVQGSVQLGLWKAGTPASVNANVELPAAGATSFAFCLGDGSGTACPCGNNSATAAGAGCLNSLGAGATLSLAGTARVSADTLVLFATSMPDSRALYFQGRVEAAGGAGVVFGDGILCLGGTLVRLVPKLNVGGGSHLPAAGDRHLSVMGAVLPGDVRTYQCWYQDTASFCQPASFNMTNACQVTWLP